MNKKLNLTEGLKYGDLKHHISETFSIDRYTSKMGEDSEVVVLSFSVKEKQAAIDLMEFIEKGYPFILDADMSTGEEHNGRYQVFAELPRSPKLAEQLSEMISGIGNLCDHQDWKFNYQKETTEREFSEKNILEYVPTSKEKYEQKILEYKNSDLRNFFDQGSVSVMLESNNNITFSKPYSTPISAKFIAIGDFESVKNKIPGKLSLDESSQSQCFFLTKYLGNYNIDKIGNKFLIQNENKAIIIEKERW